MGCCGSGINAVANDAEPSSNSYQQVQQYELDIQRRLSTVDFPPMTATWDSEAFVNLSAASGAVPGRRSTLGAFERRASITGGGLEWTQSRKILEADLAVAQRLATSASAQTEAWWDPAAWESGELVLQRRLHQLNLDMLVMEGDGNCQFRSCSFGLYGTDRHHLAVRQRAVDHIVTHRLDFESFLGEDFGTYLREMSRSGVWGDELTLRAISESYGAVISLVTSEPANWVLRYMPNTTAPRRELFLTYIAPVHYNAIRRRPLGDAVRNKLMRRHSRILRAIDQYQELHCIPENPSELAAVAEGR